MGPRTAVQPRLKVVEDQPWEVWALDTAEAFEELNFKVLVPHPVENSEDLLWSLVERPYNQTLPDGSRRGPPVATARFWTNMHAPPGRAFAVEGMNRLSPVQEWLPKLYATLGVVGSVDLYCSRVGRRPVNSYGWHTDTVDALIYVLNGTKRVRVAGHFPGSRVTLDKATWMQSMHSCDCGCCSWVHTCILCVGVFLREWSDSMQLGSTKVETFGCKSTHFTAECPTDATPQVRLPNGSRQSSSGMGEGAWHNMPKQNSTNTQVHACSGPSAPGCRKQHIQPPPPWQRFDNPLLRPNVIKGFQASVFAWLRPCPVSCQVISAGSVVYVPGGRFHSLRTSARVTPALDSSHEFPPAPAA
ncbi:unnamed protein product [Symbiodinium natans]|uniref:JmjC domain-containing protein n=1 Tax=Symbiodinium natans TaxID=878477 RepID=A0A812UDL9_9DINO|nr:unnamed protein product [Symbiodinium natans]